MSEPALIPPQNIVIASRESALALWQAEFIAQQLRTLYPQCAVSILGMTTIGDKILDTSLAKIGGKGLFVKELEQALADGRADIAVHSMKDVPMHLPPGFTLAAITEREDPRDAFICNDYPNLAALPAGSIVGTSSLRRECQIRARHPDLVIHTLRGNVGSRLKKLDNGQYTAIILAAAGLNRLGLGYRITSLLSPEESLPAVGQGALGIECCDNRADLIAALQPLNHAITAACVTAERAMSRALSGSCQVPLGGFAEMAENTLSLRGFVSSIDAKTILRSDASGTPADAEAIGQTVASQLKALGAETLLAQAAAH